MTPLEHLTDLYIRERLGSGHFVEGTAVNVRCDLRAFCAAVGPIDPAALTTEHIERWMATTPGARSTRRKRFSYVRVFCQWLVRRGHLAVDPTLPLRSPKVPRPVPRGLPPADITRLLASLPDERAVFIVTWMVQLGLRCVELARLELHDVDFAERTVMINGKGEWARLMPIVGEASSALALYMGRRGGRPGPLLPNPQFPGNAVSANHISRLVSRWMQAAQVPGSAHGLRHSCASHLLRLEGVDLIDVQSVLGHQSLTSTAVYLPHSSVERLRKVMEGRWYGPHRAA